MHLCDDSSAILRIVNVPLCQWRHLIGTNPQLIGRSLEADIPIPGVYQRVSLRHAEIRRDGGLLHLTDLGSQEGTWVNGVPLPSHRATHIVVGDVILLAEVELRVELWPYPAASHALGDDGGAAKVHDSPAARWEDLKRLSARELDIVMWMRRGYTDDIQLSQVLERSPHTIRTQVGSILRKLDLHSRAAVIAQQLPPSVIALGAIQQLAIKVGS